jgi:triacylglycerol lipase
MFARRYRWTDAWFSGRNRIQVAHNGHVHRLLDARKRVVIQGSFDVCMAASGPLDATPVGKSVILLHGLGMRQFIMGRMARRLRRNGWHVVNFGYASMHMPMDEVARLVSQVAHGLTLRGARTVSLVGHSLGGIVAAAAAARADEDGWRPGHLVLLGSPIQGSSAAEAWDKRGFFGIAGTGGQAVLRKNLGIFKLPDVPVLVIAGGTGFRVGVTPWLKGDNDGTVTVQETIPSSGTFEFQHFRELHGGLPRSGRIIAAVERFLETPAEHPAAPQ